MLSPSQRSSSNTNYMHFGVGSRNLGQWGNNPIGLAMVQSPHSFYISVSEISLTPLLKPYGGVVQSDNQMQFCHIVLLQRLVERPCVAMGGYKIVTIYRSDDGSTQCLMCLLWCMRLFDPFSYSECIVY